MLDEDMDGGLLSGVLRSKGLLWIASRNDWAYDWSQAGCSIRMNPAGFWWAAAPDDEWPEEEEAKEEIRQKLVGEHGDRHQELVFIGQGIDQHKIESLLDDCLLTDEEYHSGPLSWVDFEDPLPPIELEVDEEDATEGRQ